MDERILHENIDDLKRFQDVVVDFLNKEAKTKFALTPPAR